MKNYKISIITVVKNDVQNIEKTIKSLLKQNYKNFEHIIIDGKSTDGTLSVIKKYRNIKLVSKRDKNLWDAMNTGIKHSKGDIIGILNSNDVLYKKSLVIVNSYFNKFKLDFLFGAVKKNEIFYKFEPKKIFYRFNIYPSHSIGFFIKSNKQKQLGYYNTDYDICSDYDLFYRMIVHKKMKGISTKKNEVLGKFDMNGLSTRVSTLRLYYQEMKIRFFNGQNFFLLFFLFFIKILNKLRNKFI
jgi:glycosyltransferase involved in cell wall biosynthesis